MKLKDLLMESSNNKDWFEVNLEFDGDYYSRSAFESAYEYYASEFTEKKLEKLFGEDSNVMADIMSDIFDDDELAEKYDGWALYLDDFDIEIERGCKGGCIEIKLTAEPVLKNDKDKIVAKGYNEIIKFDKKLKPYLDSLKERFEDTDFWYDFLS